MTLVTKPNNEDLIRTLHTAVVTSRAESQADLSRELVQLMNTTPFQAILQAIRQLSSAQGISEGEAATQLVQTFRRLDKIWQDFLTQEGMERVKTQLKS